VILKIVLSGIVLILGFGIIPAITLSLSRIILVSMLGFGVFIANILTAISVPVSIGLLFWLIWRKR